MKKTLSSKWLAGIAIPIVLSSPRIVWACAVCSAGLEDENRQAFLITTVFLSVLPLLIIGAVVWWLRGRVRRLEAVAVPRGSGSLPPVTRSSAWRPRR